MREAAKTTSRRFEVRVEEQFLAMRRLRGRQFVPRAVRRGKLALMVRNEALLHRYGLEFKLRAVLMSEQPGVQVKDVAQSLCIHPFMLSKWRKQVREGVLAGNVPAIEPAPVAKLQKLRELERKYKQPQMEHDLHREHFLGEIDSNEDNGHGLPLPNELMRSATPSWHSLPLAATRLVRDGEVPFIR